MNKNQWKISFKEYWYLYMEKKSNTNQEDANYILIKKKIPYNICMKYWKILTTELEMTCRSAWTLAPPRSGCF